MARAGQDFRRPLDLAGIAVGEEPLDGGPALGGFEVALSRDRAVVADGQDVAGIVEMGLQRRQPFVPLQHQEMGFAIHFGSAGSKPLGPFSMA